MIKKYRLQLSPSYCDWWRIAPANATNGSKRNLPVNTRTIWLPAASHSTVDGPHLFPSASTEILLSAPGMEGINCSALKRKGWGEIFRSAKHHRSC